MRSSIWNKTIPTWTGMALLLVGVIATISLVRTGILFPIRASQNEQPTNVTFSNVTDTSATLSYTTASATGGTISYGETPSVGTIVYDDRDKSASAAKPYSYHYFTINNLKPDTMYYFTILSGNETYKNNTEPYAVKTGKTISGAPPTLGNVQGKILVPAEATLEGIVYIKEASSQTLSSFVQPDGSYTVPLTGLRTTENDRYSTATESSLLTITVYANNGESTINSTIANAQQLAPVTIEQSYDFTLPDPTPEASSSAITDGQSFPTFNNFKPVTLDPQILTPEKDQSFSDLQPQFTGVAPPNRTVDIVINSTQQIKAKVTTDKNGMWKYRPAKTLEPGQHTIQITARDEAGILRTITQSFTVLALGSQFTEPSVAPPSPTDVTPTVATVTPTTAITPTGITPTSITPTGASVTPTTITPTVVTPTATLTPTATPTLTPTLFVTKAPTLPVQPPPSISPTGSESIVLMFGLAGFAIITGAVLFFFTHAGV